MTITDITDTGITDETQFVKYVLVTDTRVYEIVKRTERTLTLRPTKDGEGSRSENRGGPYPVVWTEQVPNPDAPTRVVRLRKDGTYRMDRSAHPLRPCVGTPERFTDYRF